MIPSKKAGSLQRLETSLLSTRRSPPFFAGWLWTALRATTLVTRSRSLPATPFTSDFFLDRQRAAISSALLGLDAHPHTRAV